MEVSGHTSFSFLDLSCFSKKKSKVKNDPYSPARRLTPQEIVRYVAEGSDGLLWAAYDIPLFGDNPLDVSNREYIDDKFDLIIDDSPNPNAFRNGNTLFLKVFDDEDTEGRSIEYKDVTKLQITEEYSELFDIDVRINSNRALNNEDYSDRQWTYALQKLEQDCIASGVVWEGHVPQDWMARLQNLLSEKGIIFDGSNDYSYSGKDIYSGLKALGFLSPEAIQKTLPKEDQDIVREFDEGMINLESQYNTLSKMYPAKAEVARDGYLRQMEDLKNAKERFILGVKEPVAGTSPLQFELVLDGDPGADERNKQRRNDVRNDAERVLNQHVERLREYIESIAEDVVSSIGFDGDDSVFAGSNVFMNKKGNQIRLSNQ